MRAGRAPNSYDVWQAASLLVGVYGEQAPDFAAARRSVGRMDGDLAAVATWDRIIHYIRIILKEAPDAVKREAI